MSIEGGCFCGRIRYRATEHTDSVGHCHCQHCASRCLELHWSR
jgi:hypothetical protein